MKSEIKYLEIAQGKTENAIQIMQYAPKVEVKVELNKKKSVSRRKLTATENDEEAFQREIMEYNKSMDPDFGKSPEQLEQEKEEKTQQRLRKIEEKMIQKDISQLLELKQTKFANDKIDKELAAESQSEKVSSEEQTPQLGKKLKAGS